MKNLWLISLLVIASLFAFTDIDTGKNGADESKLYLTKTFPASSVKTWTSTLQAVEYRWKTLPETWTLLLLVVQFG
ncbi:MAG: hypothetical protein QMB03_13345 [Spirosomataceae bacterium]|jgi:hypothetical protein